MNLQENIRRILREEMELNPTKRVYDYDPVRDTVPERLPFDIDKLVDSGVVFVTPAIDGDPKSETYKEWTEEPHTHLISLYNVEHSSEDGWIKKAITKGASTEQYKNFVNKIYDGKYNQILWSLEKLGINPMDMLIDMNIQENIRRILMEDYSPAGKEIIPNSIVVHKSNPIFRDNIMSEGLKVKDGECYKIYVGYGTKCKPAIFATNSTNKRAWFDSTYDDDIWEINTEMIPDVKWYKDRHFESIKKHIVTFQNIPSEALTLKYEGSGRNDFLEESIRRIISEELLIEGNIEIPQSEINKAGILLDLIKSKIDIYRENTMTYHSPMVDFKNYFKLLDKEGNPNYVSVGIYNDGNDFAPARMDVNKNTLLVNVNSWGDDVDIPLDYFEDTITHELVHSMDPLLKNDDRYKNYYEKKGAEPTGSKINLSKSPNSKSEYDRNYNKYAKSQHEYTAELTPLINKIRRVVKGDGTKIKWMFWVISNISKFNDVEDLFLRTEQYFKDGDNPLFKTTDDYWYYLFDIFNIIKPWTVKPTLYKKLINDIYLGITK